MPQCPSSDRWIGSRCASQATCAQSSDYMIMRSLYDIFQAFLPKPGDFVSLGSSSNFLFVPSWFARGFLLGLGLEFHGRPLGCRDGGVGLLTQGSAS